MSRWMMLAVLCLSVPALADRPRGGPPGRASKGDHDLPPQDEKAIRDYKLTTANANKLADAHKRVRELVEKDKSLQKEDAFKEGKSFDDSVKRIEAHPQAVSAMKSAGLSPREFVVGTFALMTASIWSGMKKMSADVPVPAYVNPDNMKFLEDHPELMRKFQSAMDRGGQGKKGEHGADEDSDSGDDEKKGDKDE